MIKDLSPLLSGKYKTGSFNYMLVYEAMIQLRRRDMAIRNVRSMLTFPENSMLAEDWKKIGIIKYCTLPPRPGEKEGSAKALMLVLILKYASGISTSGPSNKEKKMDDIYKCFTTSLWIIGHLIYSLVLVFLPACCRIKVICIHGKLRPC